MSIDRCIPGNSRVVIAGVVVGGVVIRRVVVGGNIVVSRFVIGSIVVGGANRVVGIARVGAAGRYRQQGADRRNINRNP
ncbi:MAG: hypothetical protein H6684_01495 [Deltaproteobacteria bacterium]|nr:hypothetical protein [Deltaproteobacteria bacterium]